jgi:hypothetical protein
VSAFFCYIIFAVRKHSNEATELNRIIIKFTKVFFKRHQGIPCSVLVSHGGHVYWRSVFVATCLQSGLRAHAVGNEANCCCAVVTLLWKETVSSIRLLQEYGGMLPGARSTRHAKQPMRLRRHHTRDAFKKIYLTGGLLKPVHTLPTIHGA